MTKLEIMHSAHAGVKFAMAQQRPIKHPSAHKSYAALFALCLKGVYINEAAKLYVPVAEPKFMWLRGW